MDTLDQILDLLRISRLAFDESNMALKEAHALIDELYQSNKEDQNVLRMQIETDAADGIDRELQIRHLIHHCVTAINERRKENDANRFSDRQRRVR